MSTEKKAPVKFGDLKNFSKKSQKEDTSTTDVKVEIPKEILKEQDLFKNTSEKEMILTIKEKLSFLQGNTEKSLEDLSRRLCVKEELQKAYLNKNFKAVKEYFSTPNSKTVKKPIFSNLISSKMENLSSTSQEPVDLDFEENEFDDFEVSEEDIKTNQKIKIKLVIVEISHTKKEQNIRKFLSPLASLTGQSPQFGMFHSALVVGP